MADRIEIDGAIALVFIVITLGAIYHFIKGANTDILALQQAKKKKKKVEKANKVAEKARKGSPPPPRAENEDEDVDVEGRPTPRQPGHDSSTPRRRIPGVIIYN